LTSNQLEALAELESRLANDLSTMLALRVQFEQLNALRAILVEVKASAARQEREMARLEVRVEGLVSAVQGLRQDAFGTVGMGLSRGSGG
jgi:hypothetical protein